jgi:hypothetical protein
MKNRVPAGWTYYGCWVDQDARTFDNGPFVDDSMTVDLCLQTCFSNGILFAGVENGNECWCDTQIHVENGARMSGLPPNAQCATPCNGTYANTQVILSY